MKRGADIVGAIVLGIMLLPACFVIAAVIRANDNGPALYAQTRLGKHGRTFTLYKFRTMRVNAEADGPRWAEDHDERATTPGRVLRRWYLDELPQLWNVLKGEMSFVGPRPERPEMAARLAADVPGFDARLTVKPGITGLAQAHMQGPASVESSKKKLAYDLAYIHDRSLVLDLRILLTTLRRLV